MDTWFSTLLFYLKRMGCVLFKQSVTVEGEKYIIKSHLAQGGFSTVDLAENSRTRKLFAIKRIVCHSIQDQNLANLEIEIHRKFKHENIIHLVGSSLVGEADIVHNKTSEAILVLPYYKHGSLNDELERRDKTKDNLSLDTILRVLTGVCAAVQVLHNNDPPYAHRDIKPHNVLLQKDMVPILMDLGSVALARVNIRNSRDGQFLQDTASERCSMTYRPPELFMVPSHCDITEKTDVWSLGCLLYALMFFKSPFDSVYERGDSVALAVQNGNIELPEKSSYPKDLIDLMRRMLNLDLSFRPSVNDILESLEEISKSNPSRNMVIDVEA